MAAMALRAERAGTGAGRLRLVPGLLVIAAVTFNTGLAVVNAHVMPLNQSAVIAAELALVATAHLVALANYRPQMMRWYILVAIVLLLSIYRSLAQEALQAKYLRDALLIPTFIVLGMTLDDRYLTRVIVAIHAIVMAVLVLELISTPAYSELFRIQDYYINTRGYEIQDFWNKESDLYVSAVRPDSRLFSFIDLHRLSSIFLEPVSLGSYCIIVTAFVAARFKHIGPAARAFLIAGTIAALLGSDSRLAAVSCVLIVFAALVAPSLPRFSALAYLPAAVLAATLIVYFGGLHAGSDDFPGRIAHTVELLSRFELAEFLGISSDRVLLSQAVDSGVSYLILTQSFLGLAILWGFIVLGSEERTAEQVRFTHAACIYLSLTMIVSFAFLSIKTAALLWFIHGTLQASRDQPARAPIAPTRIGAIRTRLAPTPRLARA